MLDKLKLILAAAVLIALVGPIAKAYNDALESHWFHKSLNHTVVLDLDLASKPLGALWTGSGVVLKRVDHEDTCDLTVLTAYHVANVIDAALHTPYVVKLLDGTEGQVLRQQQATDLALLWFEGVKLCDKVTAAVLAAQSPPLGGKVLATGFPSRIVYIAEGMYIGDDVFRLIPTYTKTHESTFDLSTGPGASGGGVWYRGRLVGIVQTRTDSGRVATLMSGASLTTIKEFLKDAPL